MAETEKKHGSRAASPTVMDRSRYLVQDHCLHDSMRYYHLEDLVEAVNRMLERYDDYLVS